MNIETYASRRLAAEILKSINYACGVLPVLDTESNRADEFVVRVSAEDPAFTWGTKQDGAERFPVGFMYAKLRNGGYLILANEDETAVQLAERVKALAENYAAREASQSLALSA